MSFPVSQEALYPPSLPTFVGDGSSLFSCVALRRDVFRSLPLLDTRNKLYAMVHHVCCLSGNVQKLPNFSIRRACMTSVLDEELPTREWYRDKYEPCTVAVTCSLKDGRSAVVFVQQFRPYFFLLLSERVEKQVLENLLHQIEKECRMPPGALLFTMKRFYRTWKWESSPDNPCRRRLHTWARISAVSPHAMRDAAAWLNKKGYVVEEHSVDAETMFFDFHSMRPSAWFVLKAGEYTLSEPDARASTRQIEIWCHDNAFMALAEDGEDAQGPSPVSIAPTLCANADIETNGLNADTDELFMIGVSFSWSGSLPDSFKLDRPQDCSARLEQLRLEHEAQIAAEDMSRRDARLRRREQRRERKARRAEMRELHPTMPIYASDLDSDEESIGSDAEDRAACATQRKKWAATENQLAEQSKTRPWPRDAPDGATSGGVVLDVPFLRVLLVVGPCGPIDGAVVLRYRTEKDALEAYRDLLFVVMDVDMIMGYNWHGFDVPFMAQRAAPEMSNARRFFRHSHVLQHVVRPRPKRLFTQQFGEYQMTYMPDANSVDLYVVARKTLKLDEYKLDKIARFYSLGAKHGVTPAQIVQAFESTDEAMRAIVGAYCLQDCDLLTRLCHKFGWCSMVVMYSRIMRTLKETMWTSGEQIRVRNLLLYKAHRMSFVVDHLNPDEGDGIDMENFTGGEVMEPLTGIYVRVPIVTLDFASLYPSIIRAFNLCPSTWVDASREEVERMRSLGLDIFEKEVADGVSFFFVQRDEKETSTRGVLVELEAELGRMRKAQKEQMERTTDPQLRANLDMQQASTKVSMNSAYGAFGTQRGFYPCRAVSCTTTAVGRSLIHEAKAFAEAFHDGELVCESERSVCVYGDTDSIMVLIPPPLDPAYENRRTVETVRPLAYMMHAAKVASKLASLLNGRFVERGRPELKMEFEDTTWAMVLMAKKKYTKYKSSNIATLKEIDGPDGEIFLEGLSEKSRGTESVKRDRCEFVRETQRRALNMLVTRADPDFALRVAKRQVYRLVRNEVPWQQLLITTELRNLAPTGNVVPPHVAVAWSVGAQAGERVPWVVTATRDESMIKPPPHVLRSFAKLVEEAGERRRKAVKTRVAKTLMPSIDYSRDQVAMYARHLAVAQRDASLRPDVTHYLEKQLRTPLQSIFCGDKRMIAAVDALLCTAEDISAGKYTRPIFAFASHEAAADATTGTGAAATTRLLLKSPRDILSETRAKQKNSGKPQPGQPSTAVVSHSKRQQTLADLLPKNKRAR